MPMATSASVRPTRRWAICVRKAFSRSGTLGKQRRCARGLKPRSVTAPTKCFYGRASSFSLFSSRKLRLRPGPWARNSADLWLRRSLRAHQRQHQLQIAFCNEMPVVSGGADHPFFRHALSADAVAEHRIDTSLQCGDLGIFEQMSYAEGEFWERGVIKRNHRGSARHRFQYWHAESLVR